MVVNSDDTIENPCANETKECIVNKYNTKNLIRLGNIKIERNSTNGYLPKYKGILDKHANITDEKMGMHAIIFQKKRLLKIVVQRNDTSESWIPFIRGGLLPL